MYFGKSVIAIVPARSGSKGLKNKNLLSLNGMNLVGWPITAAINSGICDEIVCSTDSVEIAEVARNFGASTPFIRPRELALDHTSTSDVILHAIDYYEINGLIFDYILLLEPTSPLTTSDDICTGLEILIENSSGAESLVSVAENISGHPDFTFNLEKNSNLLNSINSEKWIHKRRQDIDECYYIDGTIYISKVETFKQKKTFIHEQTIGMVVPKWKSFEIDDELDLTIIDSIMNSRRYGNYGK